MKFSKEFLQNLTYADYDPDEVEVLEDGIVGTSRWNNQYEMTFKIHDKYYTTYYQRGATENQFESPYEYEDDMIEVVEVEPVEITKIVYRKKKT